jgi:hypothetical protein
MSIVGASIPHVAHAEESAALMIRSFQGSACYGLLSLSFFVTLFDAGCPSWLRPTAPGGVTSVVRGCCPRTADPLDMTY